MAKALAWVPKHSTCIFVGILLGSVGNIIVEVS